MKLNSTGKREMREFIEKQLEKVPEGFRIHLDKELLDELLFEKVTSKLAKGYANEGEDVVAKFAVWSGPFLAKIDLSEISFEDVVWNVLSHQYKNIVDNKNYYENIGSINYVNTNAPIDMALSFDGKHPFHGVKDFVICGCDFSQTDLSHTSFSSEKKDISLINCNFTNTGLILDLDAFDNFEFEKVKGLDIVTINPQQINKDTIENELENCTLNGKGLIKNSDLKIKILREYDQYKRNLKCNISEEINKQLSLIRKHKD